MVTTALSISDLARATGVSAATLRSWEQRYGFPEPERLDSGHRRYDPRVVAVVRDVVRRRDAGQSLRTAVEAARAHRERPEESVFAALRRRHPHLVPQRVRKATVLALSRALEDECCARAERPALFAAFQEARFHAQSAGRWAELARTAASTVVFAAFDEGDVLGAEPGAEPGGVSGGVRRVPIAADSPLRREWVLVCEATDHPGCLVAWEIPRTRRTTDAEREFEVLWSVEPRVVHDAARVCAALAADRGVAVARHDHAPAAASADLRRAQGVLDRTLGYLDRRTAPQR